MRLQTVMANILIKSRENMLTHAGSYSDKAEAKKFMTGYEASLVHMQNDLGMFFHRYPKVRDMEVVE